MSKLSEKLLFLIKKENISLLSLEKKTGVSNAQLGKYLLGKYEPSLSNAVKIANYFNCSLDYLTGNDDILNQYGIFHDLNVEIFLSRYLELIKENNTNENQLSINLNFSRNCCQRWRKNHIFPTLTILSNLSTYFKVPIEYLIGRIDERGE